MNWFIFAEPLPRAAFPCWVNYLKDFSVNQRRFFRNMMQEPFSSFHPMARLPCLLRPMADGSEEGGESEPEECDPEVVPSPLDEEHLPFRGNLMDPEARCQINIYLSD